MLQRDKFTGDALLQATNHRGELVTVLGPGVPRLLVLVPAAFTPVCGNELQELNSLSADTEKLGVQIFILSCDTQASLAAWLKSENASKNLSGISDHWPHGKISHILGSFNQPRGLSLRHSWAVRSNGSRMLVASSQMGEMRNNFEHKRGIDWASAKYDV